MGSKIPQFELYISMPFNIILQEPFHIFGKSLESFLNIFHLKKQDLAPIPTPLKYFPFTANFLK